MKPKRRVIISYWRNPYILLLLLVCLLSSLGFRILRQDDSTTMDGGPPSTSSPIVYKVIGQGNLPSDRNSQYIKYAAVNDKGQAVTVREWAEMLSEAQPKGTAATDHLTSILSKLSYKAFFFETPPVSSNSINQSFEFVVVNAPYLYDFADGNADQNAFADHFEDCNESSCAFSSLGKDALLIAPRPLEGAEKDGYAHLASFLRAAPSLQVTETWRHAAQLYLKRIDRLLEANNITNHKIAGPVWFSTSGMGISWLHFRLDSRPKYYTYRPYKEVNLNIK